MVVVGTKSDLTTEREVSKSIIERLANAWNLPFYETSAKKNLHINDVFEDLVRQMRDRYPPKPMRKKDKNKCIIM